MNSRVIIIPLPHAQSLDVIGPADVFASAEREGTCVGYRVVLASEPGGPVPTTTAAIDTCALSRLTPQPDDTVIVVGGEDGAAAAAAVGPVRDWLVAAAPTVCRIGGVCTGAFALAAAGLLNGYRCVTYWEEAGVFATLFPKVKVMRQAIYTVDRNRWTSAGCTAGLDMALAMVEEDHGPAVADSIAARFVMDARRGGFEPQLSETLMAQVLTSDPLGPTIAWARSHLHDLNVEKLAAHASMSVRTLHRRTLSVLGVTPAKLIEKLRVERARLLLSSTTLQHKEVAYRCGFGDVARMRRALRRAESSTMPEHHALAETAA